MKDWKRAFALALLVFAASPAGFSVRPALAQENVREVLLDKANYWRLKDRPDLAAEALDKLLELNPNDPDALYQYGMLSVQQNKPTDAQRYLAKLQQVAPNDAHVADLQAVIRTGKIGPSDLSEARRLAQQGQLDAAVKKYQDVFHGAPPSSYGIEYYMTLAGTGQGWDQARQGLEKLAQESPNDSEVKLSLAQLYTYREPTRMQGIGMLAELSKKPVVADKAKEAWKQTLTWLGGGTPEAKQALEQYLAQYPNDQDIQKLLADFKNAPATGQEQSQAYTDLKKGNIAAAERQFAADLKSSPDDANAMAGLGLVRLRQQRFAEARDLLDRAIKAAPDQKNDLEPAYESAVFWGRVEDAKRAAAAKNYAGARAILGPLLAHPQPDQWGAVMVLADIETKSGQTAAAEASYRQVLRLRPGNTDAMIGLANALRAQNKTAEVEQLTSRMSPAERSRFEKAATGGGSEAEKLRNDAKAASANGDNAGATAKFKAAIAADPKNPWIRMDFARFLAGQGDLQQAFAAVDPAATGNTPTSVLVLSMFDAQQDRWIEALDAVNSIPPAQRTEDIKSFRDRIYVRGMLERAKRMAAQGDLTGARTALINLYDDPAVTTDEKRQAPFLVMNDLHDTATALQMTRDAYMRGGPGSTKAGADYVNILLAAGGHDDEAAAIMAQINGSGRINDSNREDFTPINTLLAIKAADKLRTKGNYAEAWDQISGLLSDNPDNADLLLCAGRIYASAGRSKEAMDNFDKAYQQDSGNIEIVKGVVQGAILAHEYGKADDYIKTGMDSDPQNPWFFYLKAQVAQARGRNGEAIEALRQARALNQQQTGGATGTASTGAASAPAPAPTAPPPAPNPFRSSQAIVPPQLPKAAVQ
jgi:cellulose synthase operon protein C